MSRTVLGPLPPPWHSPPAPLGATHHYFSTTLGHRAFGVGKPAAHLPTCCSAGRHMLSCFEKIQLRKTFFKSVIFFLLPRWSGFAFFFIRDTTLETTLFQSAREKEDSLWGGLSERCRGQVGRKTKKGWDRIADKTTLPVLDLYALEDSNHSAWKCIQVFFCHGRWEPIRLIKEEDKVSLIVPWKSLDNNINTGNKSQPSVKALDLLIRFGIVSLWFKSVPMKSLINIH